MHLRHLMRPAAAIVALVPICLLTGTAPVSAAPPAPPACSDIMDGSGALTTAADGTGTLVFGVTTAEPACRRVTYTLTVVDSRGPEYAQESSTYTVDNDGLLVFTFTGLPVNTYDRDGNLVPDDVCVTGTTALRGGHQLIDTAPDSGCFDVAADGSGATNFH